MDGPHVNNSAEAFRKEGNPNASPLFVIGSCGLHVIHGAFKTGLKQGIDWDLEKKLKAAYDILKNSPAKRKDFLNANGMEDRNDHNATKSYFPLKFCGHRWLENGKAISRYLHIHVQLRTFLVSYKRSSHQRMKDFHYFSSSIVSQSQCEFSLCITKDIEPFLKLFQCDGSISDGKHNNHSTTPTYC